MKRRSPYIHWIYCALVATTFASLVPVARAQESLVLLECSAGFGDVARRASYPARGNLGDWLPFRVRIANAGPSASGTLVAVVPTGNGRETRYEKRIELPSGAVQAHELLVRVPASSGVPVVAFEIDGERVTSVDVIMTVSSSDQLRIGVLDRDATALNDISSVDVDPSDSRKPFTSVAATAAVGASTVINTSPPGAYPQYAATQSAKIAPIVFAPDVLPRSWLAFASLDALVVNDAPLAALEADQVSALRAWVANGGMLVVTGAADYPGLRRSGLDALLPVDVVERRTVPDIALLESTYGSFDSSGAVVAIGALRPGSVSLLGGDQSPIVAERRYGAGRVRFVSVDPKLAPLRGWAGAGRLWGDVVRPVAASTLSGQYPAFGANMDRIPLIFDLADVQAPLVGYYFLFLFAYLFILGPLNYVVLRFKGRLEWAWVTIPAAVLVFALGTVVTARLVRGNVSRLASVSVDQYFAGEGIGFSRSAILVVPSTKDTYRIQLGSSGGFAPLGFNSPDATESAAFDETESAPAIQANLNTWDTRGFEVHSLAADEPPARVRIATAGVDVTNACADHLRAVAVVTRDGIYSLGDLDAGASAASSSPETHPGTFASWYASKLVSYPDGKRFYEGLGTFPSATWATNGSAAADEIFTTAALTPGTLATLNRPVLVAIRDGETATATLSSGARARRISLVVVYLGGAP
jgi:hypothetical protein